jgi:HK97 family phage portal protein
MRSLFRATRDVVRAKAPQYVPESTRLTLPVTWGGAGAPAQLRAMGVNETLFAIVNRITTTQAALDWDLWRPSPTGDEGDRKPVLQHAVLDFLAKPNAFMTWYSFCEITSQHMELTGEMWWIIGYGNRVRMPVEMWPVRPDRMEPVPDKDNFIRGYVYTGPTGEKVPLTLDEVVFTKMPNPEDIYRGMSPAQTILSRITSQREAAEWNAAFFRNNAQPGGIIEAPESISDEEFQTFRDRWEETHKGASAAGRVAVIEGGWKWIDRKFTHAEMQFDALETAGVEAIMRAWSISKFDLGMVDDVNRATAEASKAAFGERITMPRAERMRQALQYGILPKFGAQDLQIDYDRAQAIPADRESDDRERTSKATAFSTLLAAGVDPVQAAAVCGLPPMRVTKPEPPAPAAPPRGDTPPEPGGDRPDARALAGLLLAERALALTERQLHAHTPRSRRPRAAADPYPGGAADDSEEALAVQAAALEPLVVAWTEQITPVQTDEIAAQVEEAVDLGDVAALGALVVTTVGAATLLLGVMMSTATAAAALLAARGGMQAVPAVRRDLLEPGAIAAAELLGQSLAVAAGTEALRLSGGGVTGREVADQVRAFLGSLSTRSLADRLGAALWEAVNAGRYAVMRGGEALGLITGYVAVEENDKNTCEPCEEVDGTRYASLAEAREDYPVIGYIGCDGGIRCRGQVSPIWRNGEE